MSILSFELSPREMASGAGDRIVRRPQDHLFHQTKCYPRVSLSNHTPTGRQSVI